MEFSEKVLTEYLLYLDKEQQYIELNNEVVNKQFQVYIEIGLTMTTHMFIYQDARVLRQAILDKRVPQWLIDDIIEWQIREL